MEGSTAEAMGSSMESESTPTNEPLGELLPQQSILVPALNTEAEEKMPVVDNDFLCRICLQIINDAFMTACGHNFCYICIITHLHRKSDYCPCCRHPLTAETIFPNFLLSKLLKKAAASQIAKTATPCGQFHQALQQGCEVSKEEIDDLLPLLAKKKRDMEQAESEANFLVLSEFLSCLRKQKFKELDQIQTDLKHINEDIDSVESRRMELYLARETNAVPQMMVVDIPTEKIGVTSPTDKSSTVINCCLDDRNGDGETESGLVVARKKQLHAQFSDLQECYLQKRRYLVGQAQKHEETNADPVGREGYHAGLEDFQSVLSAFTKYSRLSVIAEIRNEDFLHRAKIITSIEFDRDDELFATAGLTQGVKVYEFSSLMKEPAGVHLPVVELPSRSKLGCLSWNKYIKNHIATSDNEGIITLWDVTTCQSIKDYAEHEKTASSVDFSITKPTVFVSGGCDCKVKIWSTKQERSVLTVNTISNILSVKFNPGSSFYIGVGSANHEVWYYDLRNTSRPLYIFSDHTKMVTQVKFLSDYELVSAAMDSTVHLWDVKEDLSVRMFRGHKNERNLVGVATRGEYIACGSETDQVFVYHKAISKPAIEHRFGPVTGQHQTNYSITALCWRSDGSTIVAADSHGRIKVLALTTD